MAPVGHNELNAILLISLPEPMFTQMYGTNRSQWVKYYFIDLETLIKLAEVISQG